MLLRVVGGVAVAVLFASPAVAVAGGSAGSDRAAQGVASSAVAPAPDGGDYLTFRVAPGAATFDRHAHSIDDPASEWVVVNKARSLNPVGYAPTDLVQPAVPNVNGQPVRAEVATALTAMFTAAAADGVTLTLQSGYRSYDTQVSVYGDDVVENGVAAADTDTARPGHSEHQTGLAVDIGAASGVCTLDVCFGQTAEGAWLAANAWRFGFVLRYPQGAEQITGFSYEPWHFRYVGAPLATELHDTGTATLEQFFGVAGGTTY